jgi:hypothetical protein
MIQLCLRAGHFTAAKDLESHLGLEIPLYEFQSYVADDYNYNANDDQPYDRFNDDIDDVQPAAKYKHGQQ